MTDRQYLTVEERGVRLRDNVTIAQYDVRPVRRTEPRFDELSKPAQRQALSYWEPDVETTHNVTCNHLHQYIPELLDPAAEANDPPTDIHFGNNTSLGFASTDDELNNKVGEIPITDTGHIGDTFTCTEYVASTELNNFTLVELGIVSASGGLWNHAEITPAIEKTRDIAVIVNVDIPMSDAAEL